MLTHSVAACSSPAAALRCSDSSCSFAVFSPASRIESWLHCLSLYSVSRALVCGPESLGGLLAAVVAAAIRLELLRGVLAGDVLENRGVIGVEHAEFLRERRGVRFPRGRRPVRPCRSPSGTRP